MFTIAEFKPAEIFPHIPSTNEKRNGKEKFEFVMPDGHTIKVKVGSARLVLFKENPSCVCCGLTGSVFLLQHHTDETPHFNFYAVENDDLVLMTKDHIKPASKGGSNSINNLQTMCSNCNGLKGGWPITNEQLRILRTKYLELLSQGMVHKKAFHIVEKVKRQMCSKNGKTSSVGDRVS